MIMSQLSPLSDSQFANHNLLLPLHCLSLEVSLVSVLPHLHAQCFSWEHVTNEFNTHRLNQSVVVSQEVFAQTSDHSSVGCKT
jgi:hypothetical protein